MDERDQKYVLLGRVAAAGLRAQPEGALMGMAETVAWIALRNPVYCEAVRTFQNHDILNQADALDREGRVVEAVLWGAICADADQHGVLRYLDAQAQMIDAAQVPGGLIARGRMSGSNWQPIPSDHWIAATIIFTDAGDTLAPFGSDMGISAPPWESVRFVRSEVMERWPAASVEVDEGAALSASVGVVGRDTREREARRVAGLLDDAGISKRKAQAPDVAERWNPICGKPAAIEVVRSFMVGKRPGRPHGK